MLFLKSVRLYAVPDKPPTNVSTENINETSVLVTWNPVPVSNRNGIILGYRVLYNNTNNQFDTLTVMTGAFCKMSVKLLELEKKTQYCIRVSAFTRKGFGEESTCPLGHANTTSGNFVLIFTYRTNVPLRKKCRLISPRF